MNTFTLWPRRPEVLGTPSIRNFKGARCLKPNPESPPPGSIQQLCESRINMGFLVVNQYSSRASPIPTGTFCGFWSIPGPHLVYTSNNITRVCSVYQNKKVWDRRPQFASLYIFKDIDTHPFNHKYEYYIYIYILSYINSARLEGALRLIIRLPCEFDQLHLSLSCTWDWNSFGNRGNPHKTDKDHVSPTNFQATPRPSMVKNTDCACLNPSEPRTRR